MNITQTFQNAPGGTIYFNLSKRDFSNIQNNETTPQPKRRRLSENVEQVIEQDAVEEADGQNNNDNVEEVIEHEVAQRQFNANDAIPGNFDVRVRLQHMNREPQQPEVIRPIFNKPRNFQPDTMLDDLVDTCIDKNVAIDVRPGIVLKKTNNSGMSTTQNIE